MRWSERITALRLVGVVIVLLPEVADPTSSLPKIKSELPFSTTAVRTKIYPQVFRQISKVLMLRVELCIII